MLNGKEIEVGPVQAASFSRAGRSQMAYRFVQDSIPGYWDQTGQFAKGILKAPLKFSRSVQDSVMPEDIRLRVLSVPIQGSIMPPRQGHPL